MAKLPKAMFMFDAIPIKIPMTFCTEIEKSILIDIWKHKRHRIVKAILSKKPNAGSITISNFKLFYRAITIKTVLAQKQTGRQWTRIEDPGINLPIYSQLIFDKGASSTHVAGKNWISTCRRLELNPCLFLCTKINSKWIKGLKL
jgi:hypothetical protein